jgi:hypothetical protein
MVAHWNQQLHDLGYHDPAPQPGLPIVVGTPKVGEFDRDAPVESILGRLGARRSAWNPADIRDQAEMPIAAAGLVVDQAVRTELAEDLTARPIQACVPLLDQSDVPEHVRSLTSPHVLAVEAEIVGRLASRAEESPQRRRWCPRLGRRDSMISNAPHSRRWQVTPGWLWSRALPARGRPPPWLPPRRSWPSRAVRCWW